MSDFAIRAGSIDVEEIMRHIRTRIRDKRGVDYTDKEIQELANVKLERILDPTGIRSGLLEHYRARPKDSLKSPSRPPRQATGITLPALEPMPPNYGFEADTIYESTRGLFGKPVRLLRRLLNPLLKLFFNPNPIIHVLHMQSDLNRATTERFDRIFGSLVEQLEQQVAVRHDLDTLSYEVLNNLVVEITKLGIEVKNLKMQVQSFGSRLDFDERRARALEGLVKPSPESAPPEPVARAAEPDAGDSSTTQKRRRRRRGGRRRGGEALPDAATDTTAVSPSATEPTDGAPSGDHSEPDGAPSPAESSLASSAEPAPIPSVTEPAPASSVAEPAPTPSSAEPAPIPSVTEPASTPSVAEPAPASPTEAAPASSKTESTAPEAAAPTTSDAGATDTSEQ